MRKLAWFLTATCVLMMLSTACDGGNPSRPTSLPPAAVSPPHPSPPPAGQPTPTDSLPLVGQWAGSSLVDSTSGVLPECIAPFWRPGFTDSISVEIQTLQLPVQVGSNLDLHIRQQASEECHLQVGVSQSLITTSPWPFDEFDCALVPALCGLGCHFQLKSSEWGCPGTPPEVWIGGINLTGTFTDALQSHIQGTLEIPYGLRPGNSHGGYSDITVVKRFELAKDSR